MQLVPFESGGAASRAPCGNVAGIAGLTAFSGLSEPCGVGRRGRCTSRR